jgi:ParB family transcriptional regulator, chromosome partitioning protein
MAKTALGRGLGALLGGATEQVSATAAHLVSASPPAALAPSAAADQVHRVSIGRVRASALQPRKDFSPEALRELADSIREQGILQPLVVRRQGDGFELIAGERRLRAAQLLGMSEVPILVREADDPTVLELMLIENLQRENLNPIEEAHGYAQLIEQFRLKQEEAAAKVGRSRAVVANALRLLRLPVEVQGWVREGRLSVGHAKVILGLEEAREQTQAAERVLAEGLNVRQIEEWVAHWKEQKTRPAPRPPAPVARDVHVAELERKLQQRLGTKVELRYRQGKGKVEVRFYSDDELERLLQIFGVKVD